MHQRCVLRRDAEMTRATDFEAVPLIGPVALRGVPDLPIRTRSSY